MTFDINTFAETSVTATICENAALFGATPERGEFDHRDIWDADDAISAVSEAFRIIAESAAPDGFQIADERERLLWGFINGFDAQVRRLDRSIDKLTPEMRDLERTHPGRHRSQGPRAQADHGSGTYPLHAGAGPRRASPDRPRRAAARAADGDSGRCRCTGSRRLRADGPTRWRRRTWCAVCHARGCFRATIGTGATAAVVSTMPGRPCSAADPSGGDTPKSASREGRRGQCALDIDMVAQHSKPSGSGGRCCATREGRQMVAQRFNEGESTSRRPMLIRHRSRRRSGLGRPPHGWRIACLEGHIMDIKIRG